MPNPFDMISGPSKSLAPGAKSLVGGAWDMMSDPFKGETVDAYEPDQENFKYRGQGEGYFQQRAEAADKKQMPWQVNAARQQALASRAQIGQQMLDTQRQMRDPNSSVAQQQLRAGTDTNMAQAIALARSASGGAGAQAAALRQAQFTNSTAGTQASQQAAMLRAQEQTGWQSQLNQLAVQQRAADLQSQGLEGQLGLGLMSEQTKASLGNLALGQQAASYQQRGGIGYEQTKSGNIMAAQMANQQADAQRDASIMGMGGAVLGGLALGGAFSDVRGKVDIAPVAGTYAEGLNMPSAPSQEQVDAAKKTVNGASPLAQGVGSSLMSYGMGQMQQAGQSAGPNPYGYLQYPGMVDSDKRAKVLEGQVDYLSSLVKRLAPERPAMQTGAIQRPPTEAARRLDAQRAGVNDEASAAAYGAEWIKANSRADVLEQMRQRTEADRIAKAQADRDAAASMRARLEAHQDAAAYAPEYETSDERSKSGRDPVGSLREMAAGIDSGSGDDFVRAANARMGEGRDKKLDEALLRAGLDRIEREAVVDGGPRAGKTNVARFDNVPPTVKEAAEVPNFGWNYKTKQAVEKNLKLGLPPDAPQGFARHTTPVAQDMERSPLYAPAVVTGPDGMKRVDSGTVSMANAGVLSDLARFAEEQEARIKRLEAGRGRVKYPKPREAGL